MSNVVNFTSKKLNEEEAENLMLERMGEGSDAVLETIDQHFDKGVFIGILGNKAQLASTLEEEDMEEMVALLEEALESLYEELDYEEADED